MRTTASSPPTLDSRFPDDAPNLLERAEQARQSRLSAGIHVPIDNEIGALGGAMIGRLVVVRPRGDCAA
jgi:hypothetical protein